MLIRTVLTLPLLLALAACELQSPAASAPEPPARNALEMATSALVKIAGVRGGTLVRGSGFVVALDPDKATIVTASHVIEGAQKLQVLFAANSAERFPVDAVLGMDASNTNGLAVLQVRGEIPAEVVALSFEVERRPRVGEALYLLGFPEMASVPHASQRVLSARSGTLLLVDQDIGEGFSGGPVLQSVGVVGVVTATDVRTTYVVNAIVAREAAGGFGADLCAPGQERIEDGIVYVRICPGTFLMGSSDDDSEALVDTKPAHPVTLSEFWIGKTEVTNEQYRRVRPDHEGEAELPATRINWFEAKAACEHLGGRLPTEAEWEYAARAGSQNPLEPFGNDASRLGQYAWYRNNALFGPRPVGTKKPNAWGLHDMYGNAAEWVADWHGPYPSVAQFDPTGPSSGRAHVLRGGCFTCAPNLVRSTVRLVYGDAARSVIYGFRCVWEPRRRVG